MALADDAFTGSLAVASLISALACLDVPSAELAKLFPAESHDADFMA